MRPCASAVLANRTDEPATKKGNLIKMKTQMRVVLVVLGLIAAITIASLAIIRNAKAQDAPIGWIYAPYTQCANPPQCSMGMVTVQADGLNVRVAPNGASPAVMALVNGTVFYPLQRDGNWMLIAAACDLTPTWLWSWNANVPLNRCWVYY
jgi:hypothetical protein